METSPSIKFIRLGASFPGMFSPDLLEKKNILITGGATGLGRSMAFRFGSLGATIGIMSRNRERLAQTADELKKAGIRVSFQVADVRKPDEIHAAVDAMEGEIGHFNALVNNAAGNFISPTESLSPNAVDSILDIVLHGTFYCTLDLGKRWIGRKDNGTVLNIVTTYATTGSAYVSPSAAAKAGVLALTKSLAAEWARYGIRHVAIAPGAFPTEGAWSRLAPTSEISDRMLERIPFRRFGTHDELTNLAAFLISDGASFINGEAVAIDGGEAIANAAQFGFLSSLSEDDWKAVRELARHGKT